MQLTYFDRIHKQALEAKIMNDTTKISEKLSTELGFSAPHGSIQENKAELDMRRDSEAACSETPDDEEPNDAEKRSLRRSMCLFVMFKMVTNMRSWRIPSSLCLVGCSS